MGFVWAAFRITRDKGVIFLRLPEKLLSRTTGGESEQGASRFSRQVAQWSAPLCFCVYWVSGRFSWFQRRVGEVDPVMRRREKGRKPNFWTTNAACRQRSFTGGISKQLGRFKD